MLIENVVTILKGVLLLLLGIYQTHSIYQNECEVLPGVAYPGVRDNRSTLNTKTGYDDDDDSLCYIKHSVILICQSCNSICFTDKL